MQIASILSDLTSLRVCDPTAAQNLVSARPISSQQKKPEPDQNKKNEESGKNDPDLQRAKDLVDLHANVKVKYEEQGLDAELESLRERVESLVAYLDRR